MSDRTMVAEREKIYAAELWARLVKKACNYVCGRCGSGDDVQSTYLRPPSLGGRNMLSNGIALCVICRSKPYEESAKVRFNFSIPLDLDNGLNSYCERSGRSINDVVKQLLADFLYESEYYLNGFHEDASVNTTRRSIPVLRSVHDSFVRKCAAINRVPGDVMKSLIFKYIHNFQGGNL